MYVVLADATYVFLALVALAVGFGLCVAALILHEALSRGLKPLLRIKQGENLVQRRPQSSTPDSAVAQPVPVPAVRRSSLHRVSRERLGTAV